MCAGAQTGAVPIDIHARTLSELASNSVELSRFR